MDRPFFEQPDGPVDAGALIEPPFLEGCIRPHAKEILAAEIEVRRNIEHLHGITARFAPEPHPVEPDLGIAENAVETEFIMAAFPKTAARKPQPVPPHACLGVLPSDGLIAV